MLLWKVNFPFVRQNPSKAGNVKNRLEELRRARGVNQEELAEALEVTRQTISSLEKGRYNPSIILAFRVSRYFGLPIEDVFIYEEEDHG